jgi:hypothetical protein
MITSQGIWSNSRPVPIVSMSLIGTSRSSTPPVMRSAKPSAMPNVPSVTISAGIRALATRKPLITPQPSPEPSAAPRPSRIVPQLSPPTAFISLAEMTPLNTRTAPIERSIPAVMITNVIPTARTSSTAASVKMFRMFESETKLL